jgi:hypothetical protein
MRVNQLLQTGFMEGNYSFSETLYLACIYVHAEDTLAFFGQTGTGHEAHMASTDD